MAVRNMSDRFQRAKYRAGLRGIPWKLTLGQFASLFEKPCHYCGNPTKPSLGSGLDRKNSSLGYTRRNVVPACHICNTVKGNVFTEAQMLILGPIIATFTITPQRR